MNELCARMELLHDNLAKWACSGMIVPAPLLLCEKNLLTVRKQEMFKKIGEREKAWRRLGEDIERNGEEMEKKQSKNGEKMEKNVLT